MNTIFVYDKKKLNAGSTLLRGINIANKLGWGIGPLSVGISGKRLICLKMKSYSDLVPLTADNEVIIDMVDFEFPKRNFREDVFKNFDYGIFSCRKQLEIYAHGFKYPERCRVIYHHWDERLRSVNVEQNASLSIGYFGAPNKCYLPNKFEGITYHFTPLSKQSYFLLVLPFYSQHNAHYIIKTESQEAVSGSLLKLANASAIGCPVITVRQGYDELLTGDYPFYCESFESREIQRIIDLMEESYMGNMWNTALDILKSVKARTDINEVCKLYP